MGKIHDRFKSNQARVATRAQAQERQRKMDLANGVVTMKRAVMTVEGGQQYHVSNVRIEVQKPRKGHKDELCNVTACQKPGAYYFNTGTKRYYCLDCACQIRPWGLPDFDLFPDLKPDEREGDDAKHFWAKRRAFVEVFGAERGVVRAERDATDLFRLL